MKPKHMTTGNTQASAAPVPANPAAKKIDINLAANYGAHAIQVGDQGANGHYTGTGTAAIGA